MTTIKTTDNKNFEVEVDARLTFAQNGGAYIMPEFIPDSLTKNIRTLCADNNWSFDVMTDSVCHCIIMTEGYSKDYDLCGDNFITKYSDDLYIRSESLLINHDLPTEIIKKYTKGEAFDIICKNVEGRLRSSDRSLNVDECVNEDVILNITIHVTVDCELREFSNIF